MAKALNGKIVSLKPQQTAIVEVVRYKKHPLYQKLMKVSKKYQAATRGLDLKLGERVSLEKVRPLSKNKHFAVVRINKKEQKS